MSWFCSKCGEELGYQAKTAAPTCKACKRVELAKMQWATEGMKTDSLGYLFTEIVAELDRARSKFPGNAHLNVALVEEVGELAKEFLEGGSRSRIRSEAIQVVVVAIRLALEGDADFGRNFLDEANECEAASSVWRYEDGALVTEVDGTKWCIRRESATWFEVVRAGCVVGAFSAPWPAMIHVWEYQRPYDESAAPPEWLALPSGVPEGWE